MTKQEVRKAWVKALRSGEYKQGRYSLCTLTPYNRYCCLGVLAELAVQHGIVEKNNESYDGRSGFLSSTIMKWVGLRTDSGEFTVSNKLNTLSILNDNEFTFSAIADIIEQEPSGLFIVE